MPTIPSKKVQERSIRSIDDNKNKRETMVIPFFLRAKILFINTSGVCPFSFIKKAVNYGCGFVLLLLYFFLVFTLVVGNTF
jgi:hypothetical protein